MFTGALFCLPVAIDMFYYTNIEIHVQFFPAQKSQNPPYLLYVYKKSNIIKDFPAR